MIIGLTGGIGSGKSTIAKQLRSMGYAVYDTDSEAKRLIVEDAAVRRQMVAAFGEDVYKDGIYQTSLVAARVFADPSMLHVLNGIVHPAVKADIQHWASGMDDAALCFVECAILYSSGIIDVCDRVVQVVAPVEVRLSRTVARDQSTIEKVRARMRAQAADEEWKGADLVVNNDGKTEINSICLQIRDFFCTFARLNCVCNQTDHLDDR